MGIKRCKLPRKLQLRLLENFVFQVTARSAAAVHGIQANTVALFPIPAGHVSVQTTEKYLGCKQRFLTSCKRSAQHRTCRLTPNLEPAHMH